MSKPAKIVPAVLTDDPSALETMLHQAETFTNYVQIDIMDGRFVPSHSITWEQLDRLRIKVGWEAHLMVQQPERLIPGFHQAGARKLIFHYEATESPDEIIALGRSLGVKVGLAVNPETAIATVQPLVDRVDSVLLMTVHPGFYGSQFLPEVMDKVAELRLVRPNLEIGIDGGVKESNITRIVRSGVDVIYVGSAVFLQPDPGKSYRHLQALAGER
jgi:ribulose-phosphate 3-epimerase